MAISLPAYSSSYSAVSETPNCKFLAFQQNYHNPTSNVSFSKTLSSRIVTVKAQLNEVALNGSNTTPPTPLAKSGSPDKETKNDEPTRGSFRVALASEESISEFMSQVVSLVKLVDSRDIAELQLKQLDCEILIRKKEAIPQSQTPISTHVVTTPSPPPALSSPPPNLALPAPAPAAKPSKPSLPPLKSPMSGNFYRSPAPGEPPFVKVGDKVQKGQVICILEAMKLMNEIEADQSGTVVEIIAEDGKPVSHDSPLLVIQP